jgi:2-succinyl-5-enolpyruvyl-6-hydroxy-3-cyclohexene-1-carboxylate synthase
MLAERAESENGASREKVETDWPTNWKRVISTSEEWLQKDLGQTLTEQTTARTLSECLNSDVILAVASSNPIRHMDLCSSTSGAATPLVANRGASGIDGTIATAMGFSDGHRKRPVVLIGDLALLHDMNSLALCASRNAIVVVINNDGGGIFSYLPVREQGAEFETLFGTPHGFGFENAAAQFGLAHSLVSTIDELRAEITSALDSDDPVVIEVRTQRDANLEEQRRILGAMAARIERLFGN